MARFTQEDTYRGDGLNLYAYCRNNPVSYVDPSGHCSKDPDGGKQLPAVIPEGKQLPAIYVPQQEALLRWYANFQNDTGTTTHTGNGSSGEFMPPAVIPKQPLPSLDSLQSPLMPEPPRQLPAVIYPLPQNLMDGNPQNRVSGPTADVPDNNNRIRGNDGSTGSRFPENPSDLFPENYTGLEIEIKSDGKIDFTVQAGDKTYKIEYHPKHIGDGHFDGNHYHVLKLGEYPKPGKTNPPFFRIPNLDPNTPAQGGTFAPGDLLPTRNGK